MDKENNIVYVQTKNGIFKCQKSEQMHKPIYYPVENKTNGYIDYNEVICVLTIDDLYKQIKKQKEVINKAIGYIEKEYYSKNTVDIESIGITTNKLLQVRNILKEYKKIIGDDKDGMDY